jgi:hypothetical protein
MHVRRDHDHMPALTLELKLPRRGAVPCKAKTWYISLLA